MYLTTGPAGGGGQGVASGQQIGVGQAYGGSTGYTGGGGRMGMGNMTCFNCGKVGHMARDCWSRQGRNMAGPQGDPELEEIKEQFRQARKEKLEQEEMKKKEEEKRIREEEETRRNLDFARKAEEFKLQLRAELLKEWRKNHAEARKATETTGRSTREAKKKKKKHQTEHGGQKRRRTRRNRKWEDTSEDTDSSCSTDDDTLDDTTSESGSDGKRTRNKTCVTHETGKLKTIARTKGGKGKGKAKEVMTPVRIYEKGECSKARREPQGDEVEDTGTRSADGPEPKTPLTGGFKGLAAGCSQKGLIEYCISAHKIYSAKKADALRKICEQKGIKYTKKPEIVEILARHQVQLAYDDFDETQGMTKDNMKMKASGTPRKEFVKDRTTTKKIAKEQEPTIIRSASVQPHEDSD
ncbi:hypothetical protein CBR_g49630 [Chara braunii]|uniref:CCHC-type domain-containing protein n=1 Tax=Chara braunii TaxID=69332 RepID=A0A388M5M0_CHABU|nr:hypothetical protein CBR_g49630 [Chara braunii]|eukprot:GBG89779.1 hypothetical protein CBR_g49630 [Chara braunii]